LDTRLWVILKVKKGNDNVYGLDTAIKF